MKYHSIRLTPAQRERFVLAMTEHMAKEGMTVKDLADRLGRTPRTIYNFRSATAGNRDNGRLAADISNTLGMLKKEWA